MSWRKTFGKMKELRNSPGVVLRGDWVLEEVLYRVSCIVYRVVCGKPSVCFGTLEWPREHEMAQWLFGRGARFTRIEMQMRLSYDHMAKRRRWP
jgi:hypothetical protein